MSITAFLSRIIRPRRGFSLLEVLLVIAVLAILAALLFARHDGFRDRAAMALMQADLHNLGTQQSLRFARQGGYSGDPETEFTGWHLSEGVTLLSVAGSAASWTAQLAHSATDYTCSGGQVGETALAITCSDGSISFEISDPAPLAGVPVTFDASGALLAALAWSSGSATQGGLLELAYAAESPAVETLVWSFGDGDELSGPPASHTIVEHAYSTPGQTYQATLTLVLSDGSVRIATHSISVGSANAAPTAVIDLSDPSALVGQTVTFSAAASQDPDGQPLTFSWTFGDAGVSTLAEPTHAYTQPGTYTVTLVVTDVGGLADTASVDLPVSSNGAPTAVLSVSPATITLGESISYTAAGSTDPEGHQISYVWAFGDYSASSQEAGTYTYVSEGSFTVSLTVTDPFGATDVQTTTVTVLPAATP